MIGTSCWVCVQLHTCFPPRHAETGAHLCVLLNYWCGFGCITGDRQVVLSLGLNVTDWQQREHHLRTPAVITGGGAEVLFISFPSAIHLILPCSFTPCHFPLLNSVKWTDASRLWFQGRKVVQINVIVHNQRWCSHTFESSFRKLKKLADLQSGLKYVSTQHIDCSGNL